MDYMTRLEEKIWSCLTHLQNRDFEKLREAEPGTGPLEELYGGSSTPDEFARILLKETQTDNLEAAAAVLGQIDEDKALIRECQLLLIAMFLDIEDHNVGAFCSHLMHIARHASTLAEHAPNQYDRLCGAAMSLADDDFWRFEVASRAAMCHHNAGNEESVRQWLERLPRSDPGVFEPRIQYLRSTLESSDG